jgi:type IV pilus assembly protein PilK
VANAVLTGASTCGAQKASRLKDMDDRQFAQWSALLEQRIGVCVPEERRSFLNTGLKLRMQEIGCSDFQEYYESLVSGRGNAQEWVTLIDRLTVHETRFFRHSPSLDLIREHCLPKQANSNSAISFHAWSLGCATGEEAYTLAMLIDDHLAKISDEYYFGITATDISQPALVHARAGVYQLRRMVDIDPVLQARYCECLVTDRFRIQEALRRRVCFSQLNALEAGDAPFGKMDLVYCQNLLIYFDRPRRVEIVNQLVSFLATGGMLIIGPGELLGWSHPEVERVRYEGTLAYRRVTQE